MSQPIPMQTPLAELLRGVPKDHRTEWEIQWAEDGTPTGHALCPIGKLCHEAADELDSLRTQLAEAKAEIERKWISVEAMETNAYEGWCWILYKGRITEAYRDHHYQYRFGKFSQGVYMAECISHVMPWPLPQPPQENPDAE